MSQTVLTAVGEDIGHHVAQLHLSPGVDLCLSIEVTGLDGAGMAVHAHLDDGSVFASDLVVAAMGSRRRIAAAGDVARWPHPLLNHELVRVEHYSTQWTRAARLHELSSATLSTTRAPRCPHSGPTSTTGARSPSAFTGSRFDFRMVDQGASGRLVGEYRHHGRLVGAITNGRPRDLIGYRRQLLAQTQGDGHRLQRLRRAW